jgi:hypothetical protein
MTAMNDNQPDEIRAVARLPGLEIEIRHRADAEGEMLALRLVGAPTLAAAARSLAPPLLALPAPAHAWLAPWQIWTQMIEAAWRPWLALLAPPGKRR